MKNETLYRRSPVVTALLLSLSALMLLAGCGGKEGGPNPSGTLEATEVDVAGTMAGKVLEVRTDRGRKVRAGDTLVVLDADVLRLQLEQTRAGMEQADAQIASLEDKLQQAEQNAELARTTFRRIRTLYEQGNVSEQKLDEARTQMEVARKSVSAASSQLAAARAERRRLSATLAVQQRQIEDAVLLSPIHGTVLERAVEPGEVMRTGATALRLADLSTMELRVYLDVKDIDLVKPGQQVAVLVDALEGEQLTGRIAWVSDEAEFTPKNVQTRNARAQLVYAVVVELENPERRLNIGMPAEMKMPGRDSK